MNRKRGKTMLRATVGATSSTLGPSKHPKYSTSSPERHRADTERQDKRILARSMHMSLLSESTANAASTASTYVVASEASSQQREDPELRCQGDHMGH